MRRREGRSPWPCGTLLLLLVLLAASVPTATEHAGGHGGHGGHDAGQAHHVVAHSTVLPPIGARMLTGESGSEHGEHAVHGHHSGTAPPLGMRIVNGDLVDIVDYPFQASIERRGHHTCGGAIISRHWVVSARHCFVGPGGTDSNEYRVRVGSTQRQFGGSVHPVDRVATHPGPEGVDYDVALLRVSAPFVFSQAVHSIELAVANDTLIPGKRKMQVTGYGAIAENARLSTRLLKADLTTWEHKDCKDFFKGVGGVTISGRMICAGSNKQDSCQGDSGGPLCENVSGSWKLVGVVSFGMGCGHKGYPGVYTNLAHHDIRSFIKNISNL